MAEANPRSGVTSKLAERLSLLGRTLLSVGLAGTGVLGLMFASFDPQWQHATRLGLEAGTLAALAYLNGAILVVGSAMLFTPFARIGGAALVAFLISWIVFVHLPRVFAGEEAAWLAPCEVLATACGVWLAVCSGTQSGSWLTGARSRRFTRIVFGATLLVFGAAHFLYLNITAQMIPQWLPARAPLAAFTGAGHIAAGLSIIFNVLASVAAPLLGLMFSLFVLLVHIPRVFGHPADRIEWTMLFHATALSGAAWLIAADIFAKARGSRT